MTSERSFFVFDTLAMAESFHQRTIGVSLWFREATVVYHFSMVSFVSREMFYSGSPRNPPLALSFFRNSNQEELLYRVEIAPHSSRRGPGRTRLATIPTSHNYETERQRDSIKMMLALFYGGMYDLVGPFSTILMMKRIQANRFRFGVEDDFDREGVNAEYEALKEQLERGD